MTAYRPEDIPVVLDEPAIGQGRALEAGGMMLQREHFNAGVDAGEVFKGLPGDACQSPHWGYVISGNLKVRTTGGACAATAARNNGGVTTRCSDSVDEQRDR